MAMAACSGFRVWVAMAMSLGCVFSVSGWGGDAIGCPFPRSLVAGRCDDGHGFLFSVSGRGGDGHGCLLLLRLLLLMLAAASVVLAAAAAAPFASTAAAASSG
jgi:hypothetical protein